MTPEDILRHNAFVRAGNGRYQTVARDDDVLLILHPVVEGGVAMELRLSVSRNMIHHERTPE